MRGQLEHLRREALLTIVSDDVARAGLGATALAELVLLPHERGAHPVGPCPYVPAEELGEAA
jgi:hypothetical protein